MNNLITRYTELNDNPERGRVVGYHEKPYSVNLNKAKHQAIKGLKHEERRNIIIDGDEVKSKFTIGFEIEKTRLHRTSVKEYPLFCGFEHDRSCGYEAVTHILPLVPKSMWRTKVFNMFVEAKNIIDDEFSPSNNRCGGHINIAVEGLSDYELMKRLRNFGGIIQAVFRHRLNNGYCNHNPRMIGEDATNENGRTIKYAFCKPTGFGVEFRVPSRVTSVKQMIRRYELMYTLVDFAVNKKDARFSAVCNAVKPILYSMYDKNESKTNAVLDLAKDMQKFIKTGKIDNKVCGWYEGWWSRNRDIGKMRPHYKRNYSGATEQNVAEFMSHIQEVGLR